MSSRSNQSPKLSVNINKAATLRNSRGGNNPNLVQFALDCERFGAEGITVHPRPDERHIRYQDVYDLTATISTELNIEGNPFEAKFVDLVLKNRPTQVTLVPDASNALTSNAGWNTIKEYIFLTDTIATFKEFGIRTSIFIDPIPAMIEGAAKIATDRIELYTERYAHIYTKNPATAIAEYSHAAKIATEYGLGINAGHDLSLENLQYFQENIGNLLEVSIGHALVCDAIYLGLENTIQLYLRKLKENQ